MGTFRLGKLEFVVKDAEIFAGYSEPEINRRAGTANVYWNEEYGEDVPFVFEGEARFAGIHAGSDVELAEEEVRAAINKYINMDEFVCASQESHKINGGRSYSWKYAPVE